MEEKGKGRGGKRIIRERKEEGERRGRGHVSDRWKDMIEIERGHVQVQTRVEQRFSMQRASE